MTIATVPRRRVAPVGEVDRPTPSPPPVDGAAHVRVLGRVQVAGAGPAPADESRAAELVTLLSLHPGSDAHGLAAALDLPPLAVRAAMQDINRWLGSDGSSVVREADGHYHLGGPLLDWNRLRTLVGPAVATADSASVRAALTLVTGQPLDGVPRDRYGWAASDRLEICAAVADIAHELAQRSLREGDPDAASWAARKGLLAEPVSETLWRDAVHASWQSEQVEQARDIAETARRTLGHPGSLETDTTLVVERPERRASAEDAATLRPQA
ncbi:bacterial transcriptional activator domain-containing protein [Janibacter limosus]|uniref:Bacterial transcriptional activator domain-containing protein n=1 Tax=Janibacter limosus TaxID=53458 RepID=A0AC61U1M8_9MICO|nr:bacterial transcriptional activator domain-containing protein [Janibacter limosus]UUZ43921.1 bacterial transcriptional activator domain-containing protein [Janibacter limosus]